MCLGGAGSVLGSAAEKLKELAKELGGDCFLSLRRWVGIVIGFQKCADGGE